MGRTVTPALFRLLKTMWPAGPIRLVDVGACHGDFTEAIRAEFPGSTALLFEPGPAKSETLRARFASDPSVRVVARALGDSPGDASLNEMDDPATDSLLEPLGETPRARRQVRVDRLDAALAELAWPGVDLLKTDAQGHDLRVLRGAAETLARHRPVLLVEAIFAPLYSGQGAFEDVVAFVTAAGYKTAGLHAVHADARGLLAFADFAFVPDETHDRLTHGGVRGPYTCQDPDALQAQVAVLQRTCDERLALIQELTRAAEERLALVHRLDEEVRRLQAGARSVGSR